MDSITFIGACFPDQILNTLIEQDMIDDLPANIFGWKIVYGLSLNGVEITVLNDHKIPRSKWKEYPTVKEKRFIFDGIKFINYKHANKRGLNRISKAVSIFAQLIRIKPKAVMIYCIHTPFLLPAVLYAVIYKHVKLVQVVPDLPVFMSLDDNMLRKCLKKIDAFIQHILLKKVDGWILLSKYMKTPLRILDDNYIVIEGICDNADEEIELIEKRNLILYSGAINKEYGLPELINAFIDSEIPCDLVMCGKGNYVEKVTEISQKYVNIKYNGVLKRDELKKLQKEAILLINPRSSADEYTKFSFPSKTMEYLLSGTPVMMERLQGIPDEYYDYIIEVKNGAWTTALKEFYYSHNENKKLIGQQGKLFVITKKNAHYQGWKIKKYIEGIEKKSNETK